MHEKYEFLPENSKNAGKNAYFLMKKWYKI